MQSKAVTSSPPPTHTPPTAVTPVPFKRPPTLLDKVVPFVIGGTSGCLATCVIQPIDMIKVQIQIKSEKYGRSANLSPFTIAREIVKERGFGYLYHGLSSALIRQITYTTTRMGIYKSLFNNYQQTHGSVNLLWKSIFGLTAGLIGSVVGNPADLILIRMQADSNLPVEQRRNYTGFFNAFSRIISEEGVPALWRGATPTIVRAMVLNFAMLGPFDEVKEKLNSWSGKKDTLSIRLTAAAVAGFLASFCSLPFDNIKTKLQKMKVDPVTKAYPYNGLIDAFSKSIKKEGVPGLWAGFPTFYTRIAPHVMITLILQDVFTEMWNKSKQK
jgi:solute carrier family 25 oxoglutarate transporter 11